MNENDSGVESDSDDDALDDGDPFDDDNKRSSPDSPFGF